MLFNTLITLFIAVAGTFIFVKLKIPAGAFIGAVICVSVFQLITDLAYFPPAVKTFCSIFAGSYLGTRVKKSDLIAIKKAPLAALLNVSVMICYCIFCGFILGEFTDLDSGSATLGMSPGGSTEFALVASDMGYNPATVTILHMLRMIIIVPLIPFSIKFLLSKIKIKDKRETSSDKAQKTKPSLKGFLLALLVGLPAGLLGKYLGVPAGAISFSMIAVAIVNVITNKLSFPIMAKYTANAFNGALIGARMSLADILSVGKALPLVLALDFGWLIVSAFLGLMIYKLSDFTLTTSLFAGVPGGVSDMGLIAEDMGGNPTQVTVIQLVRLVCVLTFMPLILHVLV